MNVCGFETTFSACRSGHLPTGAAAHQAGPAAAREMLLRKTGTSSARPPQVQIARRYSCTLGCTGSFRERRCRRSRSHMAHSRRAARPCPVPEAILCTCPADHRADQAFQEPFQRRGRVRAALVAGHVRHIPAQMAIALCSRPCEMAGQE